MNPNPDVGHWQSCSGYTGYISQFSSTKDDILTCGVSAEDSQSELTQATRRNFKSSISVRSSAPRNLRAGNFQHSKNQNK